MVLKQGRKPRVVKKSARRHTKNVKLVQLGEYRVINLFNII